MKAIIIGAGRGARLMPATSDLPKCLITVGNSSILDHTISAFRSNGISEIVFIGGYKFAQVQSAHPELKYCYNDEWEQNNILESLMYAQCEFNDELLITYGDIIYSTQAVHRLLETPRELVIMVDTKWHSRYENRTCHPVTEAEKVIFKSGRILQIGKHLDEYSADGEFIGLLKMSHSKARFLRDLYRYLQLTNSDKPFHRASTLRKAYLTDMLQELAELGDDLYYQTIEDWWTEIDTVQDLECANANIPRTFVISTSDARE